MSAIKQRIQAFPLAHHRPPDCWGEYFSRFAEPICTRTDGSWGGACVSNGFAGRRFVRAMGQKSASFGCSKK
jgi:hypothetical protein